SRPQWQHLCLFRHAADQAEEALKGVVVEQLFLKLAVFFDEVVEDIEAQARVRDAADQRCHRPREERYREEELLLCTAEAFQRHAAVAQGGEVWVVEDSTLLEDLVGVCRHTRRSAGGHRQISELLTFQGALTWSP